MAVHLFGSCLNCVCNALLLRSEHLEWRRLNASTWLCCTEKVLTSMGPKPDTWLFCTVTPRCTVLARQSLQARNVQ